MPVLAQCGACGKQYRMRDELAGQTLPCKECGANFRVPGGRAPQPARPASAQPSRPAATQRPAARPAQQRPAAPRRDDIFEPDDDSSGGAGKLLLIGGIAGVVLIGGIVLAVVLFMGGGEKDDDGDAGKKVADKKKSDDPGQLANNDNLNPPDNRNVGGFVEPGRNRRPKVKVPDNNNKVPGGLQPPPPDNNPPVFGGKNEPPVFGGNNPKLPGGLIPAEPGGKVQDFGKSNAVGWKVDVDPPKEPIIFNDTGKLTVVAPKNFGGSDALYPTTNSAFVAIGSNGFDKNYRDVYDLRTKRKIGQIGGIKLFFHKGSLSPDGKHFAAMSKETKGIWLWDVVGKRQLGTLPLDEKTARGLSLHVLDFASPNRLVAAGRDTPLWVWSIPEGKPQQPIDMPKSYNKDSITFSPGGRYLTVFSRQSRDSTVHVIDLDAGKEVGQLQLPGEFGFSDCKGLAYSPDGQELAGLFDISGKSRLFVWDVASGRQVKFHAFDKALSWGLNYKGPGLQWYPDKSKWLAHGSLIIDREIGGPVWTVPKIPGASSSSPARLLGGDRIAVVGSERGVTALATLPIPHDEIAKGEKVIAAGGTTDDVGLPPLSSPKWTGTKQLDENGVAGGWRLQPDTPPKPPGPLMTGALPVDSEHGWLKKVFLSRRDVGRAVVFNGSRTGSKKGNLAAQVDVYDVAGKKKLHSLPFDYPCTAEAFSPAGTRVAMRFNKGEDRVDIWSVADKQHIAGWRPFKDEQHAHNRKIEAVYFVDDDHVLTLGHNSKLVLWKIPECKAVYAIGGIKSNPAPVMSPTGKYFAVSVNRSYRFFDALTGEAVGDLPIGGSPGGAAFHPNGDRFAVMSFEGGKQHTLSTWNLKDGKEEDQFPIPIHTFQMQWCGDDHVLFDGGKLIDLKRKIIVWTYTTLGGIQATASPDGRFWYLNNGRITSLTAIDLPDSEVKAKLAGQQLELKPVLRPGMKVSLSVQLNGIAGHPNLTNDVIREWTQRLKQNGIEVAANQPLVLFARATRQATGKTKDFIRSKSRFGFGFGPRLGGRRVGGLRPGEEKLTISESYIECRIVFGQSNKAYGERKTKISNYISSFTVKEGESAQAYVDKRMCDNAAGFFRNYNPPKFLYDKGTENGIGMSKLVSGGAQIMKIWQNGAGN